MMEMNFLRLSGFPSWRRALPLEKAGERGLKLCQNKLLVCPCHLGVSDYPARVNQEGILEPS
jgi:hypothetical protein